MEVVDGLAWRPVPARTPCRSTPHLLLRSADCRSDHDDDDDDDDGDGDDDDEGEDDDDQRRAGPPRTRCCAHLTEALLCGIMGYALFTHTFVYFVICFIIVNPFVIIITVAAAIIIIVSSSPPAFSAAAWNQC